MKETTKIFISELADLLEKHKVEILVSDDWSGYAECGEDLQIRFNVKDDYDDITYGNYLDFKNLRDIAVNG